MGPRSAQASPRHLAIHVAAVSFVCLVFAATTIAALPDHDKTRSRAERALRTGDYDAAEKIYRQLLTKDPNDIDARLGLTRSLLKQRRLQDAFDQAALAIRTDPQSARGHALLGTALLAAGNFHQSVEEFHTALRLNDDESIAVAGLAMVDFYENRLASALAGLRRAVNMDQNEPDYVFSLGQAAARFERYREAADAYEHFLTIAPRTDAERRARIRGLIDFLRYLSQQGPLYSTSGADHATIPFEADDNRPIIRVRVNGSKELLRFVLDTGSGMSVLSEETARKLGVRPVARGGMARAVGGGGHFEIVYGHLSVIEIDGARIESVPVYIRHFFDEKNPVDGYLGISALGRFNTSMDYGTHMIVLTKQRNEEPAVAPDVAANNSQDPSQLQTGIDLPIRTTSSGFLSSEVLLEGVKEPLNFIVDTGASVTVVSEKVAALNEVQSFIQEGHMRVFGAAGVADNVKIMKLPKIAVGPLTRERIDAAVLDLEPINETAGFQQSGILGGNFLRHFRVVFKFHSRVLRLEPLSSSAAMENGPTANVRPERKQ